MGFMDQQFWIKDTSVISMVDDKVQSHRDILISGDRISKITETDLGNKLESDIDGRDKYLMPGLFDAHAHVYDYDSMLPMFLANGITAIRDTGNSKSGIYELRRNAMKGEADSPLIYTSGKIIEGDPPIWNGFEVVKTKQQVKQAINRQVEAGADFIKIYQTLPDDLYREAIKQAKLHGKKVVGHISGELTPKEVIQAGLDGIEHLDSLMPLVDIESEPLNQPGYEDGWRKFTSSSLNQEKFDLFIATISDKTVYFCPTLILEQKIMGRVDYESLTTDENIKYMSDKYVFGDWKPGKNHKSMWFRNFAVGIKPLLQQILKLYYASTLLAGSDTANPFVVPGFSLHEELSLLVESGLTTHQALLCATVNPAKFLDMDSKLGTVEEGKMANLILLNKNPLEDISNSREVEASFILGRYFNSKDIRNNLTKYR